MAGLLTYPNLLRLLKTAAGFNDIEQKTLVQDIQQRVLFRILTGFPFKSPEQQAWNSLSRNSISPSGEMEIPFRLQRYNKIFIILSYGGLKVEYNC